MANAISSDPMRSNVASREEAIMQFPDSFSYVGLLHVRVPSTGGNLENNKVYDLKDSLVFMWATKLI